jgi:uncharacterized protein YndB with AHSA1/START domain
MSTTIAPAIEKSVIVACTVEEAFAAFVGRVDSWWPVHRYSVFSMTGRAEPEQVVFEPFAGGRLYERLGEEECTWATVREYDEPRRLLLEWTLNPSEIEVTFEPDGDGGTRVDLVHRGLDEETRGEYDGWQYVLDCFKQAVEA